ncbi:MAG TPA: hypothetical protein VIU15_26465 [Streptomyces sp.]
MRQLRRTESGHIHDDHIHTGHLHQPLHLVRGEGARQPDYGEFFGVHVR